MKTTRVLFIATSHEKMGNTDETTGVWLEEIASPYYIFRDAGAILTIASPAGGAIPLDPKSRSIILATYNTKRFLKDVQAMEFLSHSLLLEEINPDDFDVVFIPGGHGPMWDLAENKKLKQILEKFNRENKPIGAVCHGVVGFLSLQNENGGSWVKDKNLTCFSNREEELSGLTSVVPFLLETSLVSLGAIYSRGEDYVGYVVEDGNIITGQNPASSKAVAQKIVALVTQNELSHKLETVSI